ncbi:EF-hand domain-containing protein [Rhizorhapis suberifaciens]|uniref:Ca2+-binding EF-hand superfamily protein n=1 Tax=Rhizorhapis suberifaciens TaxID=13656 RepID=A0A840HWP6_9SPHN|nr:EF-hand domain-containing protein [Rhizorhapis suberifaciens]MBB4642037.1 Ca2+-binding EF-hand superfamily protein [Rhizorhapis suberifaciens]
MLRYLLCSSALLLASPALAQDTAPGSEAAPQQGATATPEQAQSATTVDVAAVVNSEFPTYDSDKSGDLSKGEFSTWMTTLKKAEAATTGQALGDQEIAAWAGAAFAMADQDKSKAVSKTELVTYLGG